MTEKTPYTYRLTEEGDLILGGDLPEYERAEQYPHYVHRDAVQRVVILPGTRVPRRAFYGYPALRVAELSEAVAVDSEAFAECVRLSAVQLSPRTEVVAPDAFLGCPRLFCIDYAGKQSDLSFLLRESLLIPDELVMRTLPELGDTVLYSGEIGCGKWELDNAGVLTIVGGDVPDMKKLGRAPWDAHEDEILHVVIGEGVSYVGEHVFFMLSHLTSVTVIGDTDIAKFAFASCSRLTDIKLFCAVTRVGTYAFAGAGVKEMILAPSLRRISEGILQSAFALETLVLPLLPTLSSEPFLEECPALTAVKFFGDAAYYRAMPSAPKLPKHRKVTFCDPSVGAVKELNAAFEKAEQSIGAAAAEYREARKAQDAVVAYFPSLSPMIGETEREYRALERFRFDPEVTPDAALEQLSYKKRAKICKERDKERREELKVLTDRFAKTEKKLLDTFNRFLTDVKRAEAACKSELKAYDAAKESVLALETAIDGMYPLDGLYRYRLSDMREGFASFTSNIPVDIMPNAVMLLGHHRALIEGRRYDDLREVVDRVILMINEHLTPEAAEPAPKRLPPCILVAGADPAEDKATAACVNALRRAGAIVEWVEPDTRDLSDFHYDALLLCDGEAADGVFGGSWHGLRIGERRARRDSSLFSAFFLYGKPIMGIGRGCQQINLYLGGTMRWNLNRDEKATHAAKDGRPALHSINVTPDNALSDMYKLGEIPLKVLSDHTSAIRTLGRELIPIAKSHDGVIEAFVHARVPLIGVQFALDRMLDDSPAGFSYPAPSADNGKTLFASFVELAARVREQPPVAGSAKRYSQPD